jgi:MFS family permease
MGAMADLENTSGAATPAPPERARRPLGNRLLLIAGVVIAVIVAYFILAAFLPRWWAHRIGDQVDGSMLTGVGLGIFYGFVFTFLPLLVLSFAVRRGRSWKARGWLAAIAVVLAIPNLMTLSIVAGTSGAAHAGERTLDVEGPGFRWSTLVAAIVAAAAVVAVRYLWSSRRSARGREKGLREELRARNRQDDDATRSADDS